MSDSYLIAQFLARGGQIKKVESGARTLTEREVYRKIGYEPEKLIRFYVLLTGEDGYEWAETVSAESAKAAREKVEKTWPESRIEILRPA